MYSNIRIQRFCKNCGLEYTAQKTTGSGCCSDYCAKRHYKKRQQEERKEAIRLEKLSYIKQPIEELNAKEFLTVRETARLLNCSVRSIYLYIENGTLKAANVGQRMTRIRRATIDKLFEQIEIKGKTPQLKVEDCYSLTEVREKYRISEAALWGLIKRNNIPKEKFGIQVYVPKNIIDNIFVNAL